MAFHSRTPALGIVLCVLTGVVMLNAWVFQGALGHAVAGITGGKLGALTAASSRARSFAALFFARSDLVAEHIRLTADIARLQSQVADTEALRGELAVARAAAGLRDRVRGTMLEAGLTAVLDERGVRSAMINRGSGDGVTGGTMVVSTAGSLIGVVRDVFQDHAILTMVGDPALQVTGRVLGSEVTGLVRMDSVEGLILDLVHTDEPVTEGQVVVTSGNDQFPAGFVIGTVRSVDTRRTTLFAVVHLTPAADGNAGRVLLLRP